jgi:spermidine/putrescine transport system ATP-binding protein
MNAGRIIQLAAPREVYDRPSDLFVADFVGKTNRIAATIETDGSTLRLADGSTLSIPDRTGLKSGSAIVALRPEAISLHRQNGSASGRLSGIVTHRIFLGSSAEYSVAVDGLGDFLVTADRHDLSDGDLVEPNERVVLNFAPRRCTYLSGLKTTKENKGNISMSKSSKRMPQYPPNP